jgi:Polyketide cyclase / dehydrase and lipid transport
MRRRHIEVTAHSDAAPNAVFALLADGNTWPIWSPIESFELEREGNPPPEGPGAIRVFRRGRNVGRDQLVDVAPAE